MLIRIIFTLFLTGVLIYVISHSINVEQIPQLIREFPIPILIIAILISILISVLKSWRFLILLKNNEVQISFLSTLRAFLASQALTPLPGGEAFRSLLIKRETGDKTAPIAGAVITQAYLEILTATIFVAFGSLLFEDLQIYSFIGLSFIAVSALLLIHPKLLKFLLSFLPDKPFLNKINKKIISVQQSITPHLIDQNTNLPDKVFVASLAISALTNLLGGFLVFIIAYAYGADVGPIKSIILYSSSIVISSLGAFSPGGLGIAEGGIIGLLLIFNIDIGEAVAITLMFRMLTLILSFSIGILVLSIFYLKKLLFVPKVA